MRSSIFSFDYELFLGSDSGRVDSCLIQPTNKLLRILNRHSIRGIFFIDTIYLIRLQQVAEHSTKARHDFQAICAQLLEIKRSNHYLFIHLHPHWLDATYNEATATWNLSDTRRYQLSSLTSQESDYYFEQSLSLLSKILCTDVDQICFGYRAGGWSITPFSVYQPHFIKHKIKYDFTVIPGKILHSDVQFYDFRNAPDKPYYRFNDPIDQELDNGLFIEFPVSIYTIPRFLTRISDYYEKLKHLITTSFFTPKSGGKTASATCIFLSEFTSKSGKPLFVSQFEDLNLILFISMFSMFRKNKHLHSVSHPKLFTFWDYFYLNVFLFLSTFNR